MNIESLKTFIMLANCGSFTKTAQNLIVAQSTISSRIKELETELGQSLFNRGKKYAILTPAGTALLEHAKKIIDMERNAIAEVSMVGKYSGIIHIGVTHTLFDSHIAKLARNFTAKHPDISAKISIAHSEEIISNMIMANYDVSFLFDPYQDPNYICEPFINDQIILATSFVNTKYKKGITHNEMLELPLIYTHLFSLDSDWILPSRRVYQLSINITSRIIPFLKSGKWYSLVPRQVIASELEEGSFIEIPILDIDLPEEQSFMVYKKNYKKLEPIEKWINMVKDTI